MVNREDIGSWLEGPRSTLPEGSWPGERLGLPQTGRGSTAAIWRRLVSLCIDYTLCRLISLAFFHDSGLWTIAIFALENWLLQASLGATAGQRLMGITTIDSRGGRARVLPLLVRAVLLCLVVPAVIFNRDHRGLHDLAANTAVVRTR